MLHKLSVCPEVQLTDGTAGAGRAATALVLLASAMLHDVGGEVRLAGGAPSLQTRSLLTVSVSSLQGLLDSLQQRDETHVTHVLDRHYLLLVRESVHMTLEVLLVMTSDVANIAEELAGGLRHSVFDLLRSVCVLLWGVNNAVPKLSRRRRRSSLPSRCRQTVSNFEWD